MINIIDKKECCGCEACVQACPVSCISFEVDNEGFRYPKVNVEVCINCGKCERVCPELNISEPREPIECYAAWNNDEDVRMKSSSGGVFTALAESVIAEGGVVFGARFDENWQVVHDYTATVEGLAAFRGSKYVQSRIGNTFKQALDFLKQGRKVMFSGTPCQIAALNRFVGKKYDNLLTVDIICHGVPSPKVWEEWLKMKFNGKKIGKINFRDKSFGWREYSLSIVGNKKLYNERHYLSGYMRLFLKNIILRPSCYKCPAKQGRSGSDITLGDFWGIWKSNPNIPVHKGISAVCINTTVGAETFNKIDKAADQSNYETILQFNPAMVTSVAENGARKLFFQFDSEEQFRKNIIAFSKVPMKERVKFMIKKLLK